MLENQLNELSIFALRELARRTGVASPTSKKKEQLIQDILDIKSGKKQPQLTKKQGRPPKGVNYNLELFDGGYAYPRQKVSKILNFNQEAKEYTITEAKNSTVSGYVELIDEVSAILWVNNNTNYEVFYIPNNFVKEFKLKMGDLIVGKANIDVNQKVLNEIYNINGSPITKYDKKRKDYFKIAHIMPTKNIEFKTEQLNKLNIKFGENVYLYGNNNNDNTNAVINILNNAKVDEKIYINVSIVEKNKACLNKLNNVEKFVTNLTDEIEQTKRIVCLATERVKRAVEAGKNVVLVVDDVLSVSSVDSEELAIVKTLISLTKNSTKGSVTLFAVMPYSQKFSALEKLADKKLKVEEEEIEYLQY